LLQFRKWLTAWSEKSAKQQDANEKERYAAILEVHARYIKERDEKERYAPKREEREEKKREEREENTREREARRRSA
jgi:hypothetical protein